MSALHRPCHHLTSGACIVPSTANVCHDRPAPQHVLTSCIWPTPSQTKIRHDRRARRQPNQTCKRHLCCTFIHALLCARPYQPFTSCLASRLTLPNLCLMLPALRQAMSCHAMTCHATPCIPPGPVKSLPHATCITPGPAHLSDQATVTHQALPIAGITTTASNKTLRNSALMYLHCTGPL